MRSWPSIRPDAAAAMAVGLTAPIKGPPEAVGEIPREEPIPVILVSADHRPQLFGRARGDDMLAYPLKPTRPADLEAAIAIAMQRPGPFQAVREEAADRGSAQEGRKLVEWTKGLLMKPAALDEEEAFRRPRRPARDRSQELADVARAIVAGGEDP
jgi:AmiR/NasT family two-component response regulator